MLVLDTTVMDPVDRAEAFQAAVSANCTTSAAVFEEPAALRSEIHAFDLGPAKVLTIEATGTTLRRTPRMARAMNECPIALALPVRTQNHLVRDRDEASFGPSDLMLVDLSAPYVYGWSGEGASYAFHVDVDRLGLPMDTIKKATPTLRRSPLYPLVRDHIGRVMVEAHSFGDGPAAAHVGAASVELMHALIVSAAGDDRRTSESMHTSALARAQAHVRSRLQDPDLDAAGVAAATGVSVRTLYKLYEDREESLEQSIIRQRLDGARADLAAPRLRYRSIAAVARSWGFTSPSFFAHRFRQTFGVSPRQWRTASLEGPRTSSHELSVLVPAARRPPVDAAPPASAPPAAATRPTG